MLRRFVGAMLAVAVAQKAAVSQTRSGEEKCVPYTHTCGHYWEFINRKHLWVRVDGAVTGIDYNYDQFSGRTLWGDVLHHDASSAAQESEKLWGPDHDLTIWVRTDDLAPLKNRDGIIKTQCNNAFTSFNKPGEMEMEIVHPAGLLVEHHSLLGPPAESSVASEPHHVGAEFLTPET